MKNMHLNICSFNKDVFESHKCYFCIADTRPLHSDQLGCGVASLFIKIYWCFCKERNLIFWGTNLVSLLKIREAYVIYWTIMILYNSSTYFVNPLCNQVSWKLHNLSNQQCYSLTPANTYIDLIECLHLLLIRCNKRLSFLLLHCIHLHLLTGFKYSTKWNKP